MSQHRLKKNRLTRFFFFYIYNIVLIHVRVHGGLSKTEQRDDFAASLCGLCLWSSKPKFFLCYENELAKAELLLSCFTAMPFPAPALNICYSGAGTIC